MSRQDDIAAAEIAALVGGHLNDVQNKMIQRSSTDAGSHIHPMQFLHKSQPAQKQTTNNVLPANSVIEPPKSRPAGSEVVGTENVNVGDLMIPTSGMDKNMREAIKIYSQAPAAPQPPPPPPNRDVHTNATAAPQQPQMTVGSATPAQQPVATSGAILDILERIEEKLDLLLKRAKIQPRYKKKKGE